MILTAVKNKIVGTVKTCRKERKISQKEIADLLGITQARYSQIENGNGSFSAEQLIALIQKFNLSISSFLPEQPANAASLKLQKALVRFGAKELYEDPDVLPSEKLQNLSQVIVETIISADSSRQITALAPIIVKNSSSEDILGGLRAIKSATGHIGRLGWILESIIEAVQAELPTTTSKKTRLLYKNTANKIKWLLEMFVYNSWKIHESYLLDDVLDKNINSEKTCNEVKIARDPLAKKWKIITRIKTEDFIKALREADLD